MSLVGDIIMDLRARIPDAPPVSPAPVINSATGTTGGLFTPGTTIRYVATGVNSWGETVPTAEGTFTFGGGQTAISFDIGLTNTPFLNIYWGFTAGAESHYQQFPQALTPGGPYLFTGANAVGAAPPTRNTAFNPDSDGNFLGAWSAYRVLNRAMQEMVRICGGIVDVTGVQSTIQTSMYRLASPFFTFVKAWYDGYPMDVVPKDFMYLRNSAAGFSGILSYEQDGPQSVIQVWPQSNRTGGSSTLVGNIGTGDASLSVASATGFLAIGLLQVDSEVMVYSNVSGNTFGGILRGMGGTAPAAHSNGAPVTELNIRLSGYRLAPTLSVGQAANTLLVPPAWEGPLVLHMLSQVRSMEQDDATAEKLLSDFQAQADKIGKQSRLGKIKPRQIPVWGQQTGDARNVNGIGFGWLIQ